MPTKRSRESANRSRAIREQTIGSHVARQSQRARQTNVRFASQRKQRKANRGVITHVVPDTATGESVQDFSRRTRSVDYAVKERRRRRRRRVAVAVVLVLAAAALVAGVAWVAYGQTVDSKMRLADADAREALTVPADDQAAYWTLVAGEFHSPRADYAGPQLLLLMRVDPAAQKVAVLNVPANAPATLSDGNQHPLSDAQVRDGDAGLIKQVETLAGVKVAHFAKITDRGFVELVDKLGGVAVELPEEVDDPRAGTLYLAAGPQQLDGQAALEVVRAHNYESPQTQAAVQNAVLRAMLQTVHERGGLEAFGTFDAIAGNFTTDLTFAQIGSLLAPFASLDDVPVTSARVPGAEGEDGYFDIAYDSLVTMMERLNAGVDPTAADEASPVAVDPANYSVEVRNGANITGAGATTVAELAAAGFNTAGPSNTDAAVYTETLIVYRDDAMAPVADLVAATIGCGRTTDSSYYYTFETDVLVVIGSDWLPAV